MLGLGVVRLEVLVADRPRGRDAVVVPQLAEVLWPQPEQRGAVELGVAADVVVDLRRELVAVPVEPELRGAVLPLDEHRRRLPVVPLPGQVVAALEQQDLLARGGQSVREGASAGAGADHDDVVVLFVSHGCSLGVALGAAGSNHASPATPMTVRRNCHCSADTSTLNASRRSRLTPGG